MGWIPKAWCRWFKLGRGRNNILDQTRRLSPFQDHIEAYISIAGSHLVISSFYLASALATYGAGRLPGSCRLFFSKSYVIFMDEGQSIARFFVGWDEGYGADESCGSIRSCILSHFHPSALMTRTSVVLERFFSRKERQRLFRSWAGSASMWMKVSCWCFLLSIRQKLIAHKGGNTIWGNGTHAPDDESEASHTHGQLIAFRPSWFISPETAGDIAGNMTAEEAGAWILQHTPSAFQVSPVWLWFRRLTIIQ